MASKVNRPESEIIQRIRAIQGSDGESFRHLLLASGFELKSDLRYQNLSGLSFAGEDVRGIDFTGANLVGCDFTDALIEGARFESARLGMIETGRIRCVELRRARDWLSYASNWTRIYRGKGFKPLQGEDHLPNGAIFQDAPFLPLMVVLPIVARSTKFELVRVAVSYRPVTQAEFTYNTRDVSSDYPRDSKLMRSYLDDAPLIYGVAHQTDPLRYCWRATTAARRFYRPVAEAEWKIALGLSNSFSANTSQSPSTSHACSHLENALRYVAAVDDRFWEWCGGLDSPESLIMCRGAERQNKDHPEPNIVFRVAREVWLSRWVENVRIGDIPYSEHFERDGTGP